MNKLKSKYLPKKSNTSIDNQRNKEKVIKFRFVEDTEDLSTLKRITSEATKKGFERAKKVAHEIIIAQNGNLIRKRPGKPNEIISKLEERIVEIGKTTSL
jgi:hypothetical protein